MIQASEHGREAIRSAVDDVLSRPEFDSQPSQLEELFQRLDPDFEFALDLSRNVAWIVTLLLLSALAVGVWRALASARARKRRAEAGEAPGVDAAANVRALLAAARAARARGDLRGALRANVAALVVGLGQGRGLRYHPAWTNRELLSRGEPNEDARRVLTPIVNELEPKEFGREPVLPADLDTLERLCAERLAPELLVQEASA